MNLRFARSVVLVLSSSVSAWASYRIEPAALEVLGIPVSVLDKKWERASQVTAENLPADARHDLTQAIDPAFQFVLDGDFNKDGQPDKAVVGVYRSRSGEEGQFLLILTQASGARWSVAYLSKNPGFPGPSILYMSGDGIVWWPCTACDVVADVTWTGRRYRTVWASHDEP